MPLLSDTVYNDSSEASETALFQKYKEGKALPNAPFKLVALMPMSSEADDNFSYGQGKQGVRGPYRKYTCQEKQQAV